MLKFSRSLYLGKHLSKSFILKSWYPVRSIPGWGLCQNLKHLVKVLFLCCSFLKVYIFATTYRKAFIVVPKVPYPTLPYPPTPSLPIPQTIPTLLPSSYPTLPYPTLLPPPHPYPILPLPSKNSNTCT